MAQAALFLACNEYMYGQVSGLQHLLLGIMLTLT